jgi:hypothetical protein
MFLIYFIMRVSFLIISSVLILQVAVAQNGSASLTLSQAPETTPASPATPTQGSITDPVSSPASPDSPASTQIAIMDYKSVYDAATVEEEVKMAAERFDLTPGQQDVWLTAATERRGVEKQAREKLSSKTESYGKEGIYRGLRSAQNTFYETIIGHLSPAQKSNLERDRLIEQEKQKRLAKLPPPPPPPTVTVAPVDSSAIKKEEKVRKPAKKSRKKKKNMG